MPAAQRPSARRAWRVRLSASMHARLEVLLGIVSLAAGLLVLAYRFPETWWTDRRFELQRGDFTAGAMLVGLDEEYVERHGHGGVPPGYLARVVRAALAFRPTAIALDFRFGEAEASLPGADSLVRALAEARARGVPVVLPTRAATWGGKTELVRTLPPGAGAIPGLAGWEVSARPGSSPAVRAFPAAERLANGCHVLSFPVASVAAHRRRLGRAPPPCGADGTFPDSALSRVLAGAGVRDAAAPIPVYFAGSLRRAGDAPYYSSEDLLRDAASGIVPRSYTGRLVLVAALWLNPARDDQVATPFGEERGGALHFYAIDTLLRDRVPRPPPPLAALAAAAAVFLTTLAAWRRWRLAALIPTVFVLVAYVGAAFLVFRFRELLIPVAWPLWAGLLAVALGFLFHGGELGEPGPAPAGQGEAGAPGSAVAAASVPVSPPPRRPPPAPPTSGSGAAGPRGLLVLAAWSALVILGAALRRGRDGPDAAG